ncbi:MAG: glycosyltransferase family 2 protein [Verrucomicrobia bacterium]|nr:glycosyltransferase family 2 protein [Verrucomicrobiota bacterium]
MDHDADTAQGHPYTADHTMKPTSPAGDVRASNAAQPLVSIAVPVFNGATYLAETLTSLSNQTHQRLEIILVDDASTDSSVAVALAHAQRDDRLRILRQETNVGLVNNWNWALDACAGDWLLMVGQDDILAPDAIAALLSAATPDTRLVMAARDFLFEPGSSRRLRYAYTWELPTLLTLGVPAGIVTPTETADCIRRLPSPCTNFLGEPVCGLLRRDLRAARGGYRRTLTQLADYEFWLRCTLHEPFVFVARKLMTFRVHRHSATQTHITSSTLGVHVEYARLLSELLDGDAYTDVRASHTALPLIWSRALAREIGKLQRLAQRDPAAAAAIATLADTHPALARRLRQRLSVGQRLRTTLDGVCRHPRRFGAAGFGRFWRRRQRAPQ